MQSFHLKRKGGPTSHLIVPQSKLQMDDFQQLTQDTDYIGTEVGIANYKHQKTPFSYRGLWRLRKAPHGSSSREFSNYLKAGSNDRTVDQKRYCIIKT